MSMMNVKRGSSTIAAAKQESSLKSDGTNNTDAQEFKKLFGDQQLGDVLNKVADKNWVDPSKKLRATGNNAMDKDAFFKMMLAQMKHQDPTNPMQSHEMAAQLAQFTSLEQLNNINETLAGMSKQQQPSSNYQALALIGKKVSGDSSKLTRAAGDTRHEFNFDLMGDSSQVQLTIKDSAGNIVKKMDVGQMKKGPNTLDWNGIGDDGLPARAGEYRINIEAKSPSGTKVFAKTSFEGRITGLNFSPEGPILLVGKQSLKLSDVKTIEEAEEQMPASPLGAFGMNMPLPPGMSLTPPQKKQEEFIPPAEEPEPQKFANIQDVPMSQDLLNKLDKETR